MVHRTKTLADRKQQKLNGKNKLQETFTYMPEEITALKSSKDTSRGNYNSYTAHHGAQIMLIMAKQKLQFILIVEHKYQQVINKWYPIQN